jgi:hypothetical protein
VKRRRGDPTSAEMQLLAQANTTGKVVLEHARRQQMPPILTLAFEMVEQRKWFTPPGAPSVVENVRYFTFELTDAGRQAYKDRMAEFGLER